MRRLALIDIGTNTFHLLIVEVGADGQPKTLYKTKVPVKLGQGGISKGEILPDARERALKTLAEFRATMDEYGVEVVRATATSAMRNASNGPQLVEEFKAHSGIEVEVISGAREAELIYKGVQQALQVGPKSGLVMDIGGGSVEFIIGNDRGIRWKKSFEIGAQRLLDKFYPDQEQPISPDQVKQLRNYLNDQLQKLTAAVLMYQPEFLIGSSGTFDTLVDMDLARRGLPARTEDASPEMEVSISSFAEMYKEIIRKGRAERLAIPGMLEMRVDMIVVACVVIDWAIEKFNLEHIRVSAYALKEGMLAELIEVGMGSEA